MEGLALLYLEEDRSHVLESSNSFEGGPHGEAVKRKLCSDLEKLRNETCSKFPPKETEISKKSLDSLSGYTLEYCILEYTSH